MTITRCYIDFIDKETEAQRDQSHLPCNRWRNWTQQRSHVYVHQADTLKASADELTGTGSWGSKRDLGRRKPRQGLECGSAAGTGDTMVNRADKAETMGKPQGDDSACDLLESLSRAGGISVSRW